MNRLGDGRPGLTPVYGAFLAEAASVCLEDQEHDVGVIMQTLGAFSGEFELEWDDLPDEALASWADQEFATEQGAYGIAALIIESLAGLTVVERSRKGTGFDYWLGQNDTDDPLFQRKARLEVSGIRNGTDAAISARVRQKLEQTQRSDGAFPAMVVVVEFGAPRSEVATR